MSESVPKTWNPYIFLMVLTAITGFSIYILGINYAVRVDYEKTPEDYSAIFLSLFIVALMAERFVDVLLSSSRRPKKNSIRREIEAAKDNPDLLLKKNLELDIYRSKTGVLAMRISFVIGLFVSLAGVHTLGEILDTEDLHGLNRGLFITIDVVLTAGLIAGGSKGINNISSAIADWTRPDSSTKPAGKDTT